jgi:hypothetical protein
MATGKICRIDGCDRVLKWNDGQVCNIHRSRFYRHGSYELSPNWPNHKKGTPCKTALGYYRINIDGVRVLHHRYVMEQHIGRPLKKDERVHHKNGDKLDNRIENLELFDCNAEHVSKCHAKKPLIDWLKYDVPEKNIYSECLVDGCELLPKSRSLCRKHYLSWNRHH